MEISKNKVASSLLWKFFERIGSQLATFILGIVLARILSPTEYGTVALVTIFISIATVFVQGGFNTALIQKKEIEDDDYKSVLWFSLFIALILYVVLFFAAGVIAGFYDNESLTPVVRVLALILFPGAVNSIQVAYVTKQMQFKKLFISNIISVILSGIVGIVMALTGFGVWAIVVQQLSTQMLNCLLMIVIAPMKITGRISHRAIRNMIPFGSKVLASNLLVTIFLDIRSLVIGKKYSAEDLAYFNRGKTFTSTAMDAINGTVQTVMLPSFANCQDDRVSLLNMLRKTVQINCFIVFPCLIGLAAVAEPLVLLLLTEKWRDCIVYLQIFAISYLFQPMQIASAQAIKAIGKSGVTLFVEIIRKTIEVVSLIIALFIGVKAIAISSIVSGALSYLISLPFNKKYLSYKISTQVCDFIKPLISSIVMFVVVYFTILMLKNILLKLCVGILLGVIIYLLTSSLLKDKTLKYLFTSVKGFFKKKEKNV